MVCDTPNAIKRMLPGMMFALRADNLTVAEETLKTVDGIHDIQPYGDVLNLLVEDESVGERIKSRLDEVGVTIDSLRPAPPRLEEAFIYFVRQYRNSKTEEQEEIA
jgi:hypothetical protein